MFASWPLGLVCQHTGLFIKEEISAKKINCCGGSVNCAGYRITTHLERRADGNIFAGLRISEACITMIPATLMTTTD